MEEFREKIRPIDVAKKWNIPHIIDVNDGTAISKWQETFIALAHATIQLRDAERQMTNMATVVANSVTEIKVYERDVETLCKAADLNPDEFLQRILKEIQAGK